jgi:hypothetical protein
MTIYSRRPIAVHKSFDAMINRCLGSGANGVGYYMYHGGSTPRGRYSFMSDEVYGLPKISYDFQAPIGEYGQVREGFHRLKLLHFFMKDFGELLAPMTTILPANATTLKPDNITDLRYAVRASGRSGFLFLNNFQDDTAMQDQKNIQIRVKTAAGDVLIPEAGGFDLKSGENVIFPFNFNLNGTPLHYATAQLLVKSEDKGRPYYVFFSPEGTRGEFSFAPGVQIKSIAGTTIDKSKKRLLVKCNAPISEFSVTVNGKKTNVLVIDKDLALKSYVVTINGSKHLIFSGAVVLESPAGFEFLSDEKSSFEINFYPKTAMAPKAENGTISKVEGPSAFSTYRITLPEQTFTVKPRKISEKKWAVDLPQTLSAGINDIFLTVDYTGDTGMGFMDGELIADEFYHGMPWQIGLRKFITQGTKAKEMVFYFRPMQKNASYLVDLQPFPQSIPDFGTAKSFLKVNNISLTPQYKTLIKF